MITYLKREEYSHNMAGEYPKNSMLVEIACLSSDTKPTTGLVTGSLALEVDTGDVYAFDSVGGTWHKIGA